MEKIIEISCLEHIYPDKTKVEICGIEFIVNKGERVAILGPNGGGKTTLLKHILGILALSSGSIKVFGVNPAKDFKKIRHKIGIVLQQVEEQLIGPTVLDDILFSPLNYGYNEKEALDLAYKIMERLDITHLKDKVIHYLSGGEKTKVALAGALVLNPELLVMDEPFSGLDLKSQRELISLINEISREKRMTIIIATHDIELVSEFSDTMYLICSNKKISKKGTPQEIFYLKDEIEEFNLEEPNIVKLFKMLEKEGHNFGQPLSVKDAAAILIDKLSKLKQPIEN